MMIVDHRISILCNTSVQARRPRVRRSEAVQDTPYSPYLRQWITHRATQHRELLLNIHAASRIGVIPVSVDR
jgi:hypothetical protein